jgi:branched-chain amino acid transport system substrate-binding protein
VRKRSNQLIAGLLALGLVGAACSETTTDEAAPSAAPAAEASTAPAPASEAPPAETEAAPAESAPAGTEAPAESVAPAAAGAETEWALAYTGGTAGEAAGDSIKVGYVNQEDFFPENTIGIDAAVKFVNAELGGADGRPIEIVPCKIAVAEDGAKCGTEMANDPDIVAVITGTILFGNKELYDTLNGKKPVIVGNGVTSDDFTTPAGSAFTAGSPGTIVGMGGFVVQNLPETKSVAIMASNNPAGQAAADLLFKPVMEAAGISVTFVGIDDTATAADVQAAMTAVGAETADVFVPLITIQQCINVYDSIKALGINPTVVTTGLCFGTPMTDHLKEAGEAGPVPDGWYFGGYGYSYFEPDLESGMQTYVTKVKEYGTPAPGATTLEYTGFAGPSFANILTLTKFINTLGADKLDFASLDGAIRGFTGPMMIQVGPLNCGKQVILGLPIFVSVCGAQMGIQQFKDGQWTSIADGLNGKPIDATKV